jgi:hypothetical protein
VVFLACETADDEATLRERAQFLAQRVEWPFMAIDANVFLPWAPTSLPFDGVLWLALRDASADLALRSLHLLNHVRSRLAQSGGGCLVIAGEAKLSQLAMREAADLWSIRAFADYVGAEPPDGRVPLADGVPITGVRRVEEAEKPRGIAWSPPGLNIPTMYRTETTAEWAKALDLVYLALPGNPDLGAKRLAAARVVVSPDDPLGKALLALAAMHVASAREDGDAVAQAVNQAVDNALQLRQDRFQCLLLDAIQSSAVAHGGRGAVVARAAQAATEAARGLHERLGTPESARDLSVSLNRVAEVALARGELGEAAAGFGESLGLRRGLHERLGTPESARDLSVSLDRVARVALARGEFGKAEELLAEAGPLLVSADAVWGTPQSSAEAKRAQARLEGVRRRRREGDGEGTAAEVS